MEWINTDFRLPPNDEPVLVAKFEGKKNEKMIFIVSASRFNNTWVSCHNGESIIAKYGRVTHWMKLPPLPKD